MIITTTISLHLSYHPTDHRHSLTTYSNRKIIAATQSAHACKTLSYSSPQSFFSSLLWVYACQICTLPITHDIHDWVPWLGDVSHKRTWADPHACFQTFVSDMMLDLGPTVDLTCVSAVLTLCSAASVPWEAYGGCAWKQGKF